MAVTAPEVSFEIEFFASARSLGANEALRVFKTIEQFSQDPNHPSLNLHPVKAKSPRLHTIRVNDDIRILLAKEGNVYHFLLVGHHDDVYGRAQRGVFVISPHRGFIGLVEPAETLVGAIPAPEPPTIVTDDRPGVFDHWSKADLAEAGFTPEQTKALHACRTENDLFDLSFDQEDILLAIELIEVTPEQWRAPALALGGTAPEDAEERMRKSISEFGARCGISPLFPLDEVARIAAAPIEDWMIFLHPDQRKVVERRYDGPARVRGAAGTGKTVVALHRAAELAHRFDSDAPGDGGPTKILFATFVNSLPPVFQQLYERLPSSVAGAVEFTNIDRLARQIASDAGRSATTEPRLIEAAFATAWRQVVTNGSSIHKAGVSRAYLRDEIAAVIKGRGIGTLEEYLVVERTGRRQAFPEALRRHVWDLMLAWQREMGARGTIDFPDVVLIARDEAAKRAAPVYRAAIIDEAQDITMVGLQLVRSLVNGSGPDRQDGLFFVGDAAQRIYPGGFTLRQAGIEVRGRTTVLRRNYRNTREIFAAAMAVAGNEEVDDLGEQYRRKDAEVETQKTGRLPALVRCGSPADELLFIEQTVRELTADSEVTGIRLGDIGVFAPTNQAVDNLLSLFRSAKLPALGLDKYDGRPSDRLKLGTFHRAKGLEFKVVFLPGLTVGAFPRSRSYDQGTVEYGEASALAMSQLFVAMTRARDRLYVLCVGEPIEAVAKAAEHFDAISSTP